MKKKILALILTGTMVMGSCITAFAEPNLTNENLGEDGTYTQEVSVDNAITTPTIKITVPTSALVTLNPYAIETDIDGEGDGEEKSTAQIVSPKYDITSESNVPLQVDATLSVAAAEGSDVVFSTAKVAQTVTTKSVFMYLDINNVVGETPYTITDFGKAAAQNQLVAGTKSVTKKAMINMPAGTTETPAKATYTFGGNMVSSPAKAWVDTDTIEVSLKWSFVPLVTPAQ